MHAPPPVLGVRNTLNSPRHPAPARPPDSWHTQFPRFFSAASLLPRHQAQHPSPLPLPPFPIHTFRVSPRLPRIHPQTFPIPPLAEGFQLSAAPQPARPRSRLLLGPRPSPDVTWRGGFLFPSICFHFFCRSDSQNAKEGALDLTGACWRATATARPRPGPRPRPISACFFAARRIRSAPQISPYTHGRPAEPVPAVLGVVY